MYPNLSKPKLIRKEPLNFMPNMNIKAYQKKPIIN
jgi:hypothetical protein